MFLCAILIVENFGMPLGVEATANGVKSDIEVVSSNDGSNSLAISGEERVSENAVSQEDADGTEPVSEDNRKEEIVLPEVRYDFCEIDYSNYVNEQINSHALATAYLSPVVESLDKAGVSVEDV